MNIKNSQFKMNLASTGGAL